jgi:hypothetical protein
MDGKACDFKTRSGMASCSLLHAATIGLFSTASRMDPLEPDKREIYGRGSAATILVWASLTSCSTSQLKVVKQSVVKRRREKERPGEQVKVMESPTRGKLRLKVKNSAL